MFPVSQIKHPKLVACGLNLSKSEIVGLEAIGMFSLFDSVAHHGNIGTDSEFFNPDITWEQGETFNKSHNFEESFHSAIDVLQDRGLSFTWGLFNPRDYTNVLRFTNSTVDRETHRRTLITGVLSYLRGGTLMQSRSVPYGKVYLVGESEDDSQCGVLVEPSPLTVTSCDREDLAQIGFQIKEEIGLVVNNPSFIQRMVRRGYGVKEEGNNV
jgi:hypothetical protein